MFCGPSQVTQKPPRSTSAAPTTSVFYNQTGPSKIPHFPKGRACGASENQWCSSPFPAVVGTRQMPPACFMNLRLPSKGARAASKHSHQDTRVPMIPRPGGRGRGALPPSGVLRQRNRGSWQKEHARDHILQVQNESPSRNPGLHMSQHAAGRQPPVQTYWLGQERGGDPQAQGQHCLPTFSASTSALGNRGTFLPFKTIYADSLLSRELNGELDPRT